MLLLFEGTNNIPQRAKNVVADAVAATCQHFGLNDQNTDNLNVIVSFDCEPGFAGFCFEDIDDEEEDETICIQVSPLFTKKLNEIELYATICHEMTHVKQMFLKELQCLSSINRLYRYKNEVVSEQFVGYDQLPWEVEAREVEALLTAQRSA